MKTNENEQKRSYLNSTTSERKRYCMNCKKWNMDYCYCDNKESDLYQLPTRYDEVCDEHEPSN